MKRTSIFSIFLFGLIIIFIFSSYTPAQKGSSIGVTSSTPNHPKLIQGQGSETVTLKGRNLNMASSAKVILHGRVAARVSASLLPGSPGRRQVKLSAQATTGISRSYQLRLYQGRIYYDIPLNVLAIEVMAPPVRPIHDPPSIVSFKINSGERETRNARITLNNRAIHAPTHYRFKVTYSGLNPAFSGWLPYNTAPTTNLTRVAKTQTVHFQVKNGIGLSNIVTANIDYVYDVETKLYAEDIEKSAAGIRRTRKDPGSVCHHITGDKYIHLRAGYQSGLEPGPRDLNPRGTKCEWEIFKNVMLKQDWKFVKFEGSFKKYLSPSRLGNVGYNILQQPRRGGRNLTFKIRVWADPSHKAKYVLKTITIQGPWNKNMWMSHGSGRLLTIFE